MTSEDFSILATGDVGALRSDLGSMFAGVRPLLRRGAVTFGQLETTISDRGSMAPNARLAMRAPPGLAPVLRDAGYTMMSFAGNHCLDYGYEAFGDTRRLMAEAGIALGGAGDGLDEATGPVYQRVNGTVVALIAASSILPEGYAASADRAGCAPMRAHTIYEQIEMDQPGTPARIRTRADRLDLDRLIAAVRQARTLAQVVLVSLHWGIHMVRGSLADYQREVASAVIAAGADAILGHHPHLMKGVGFIRGKPVFYSLGNFAIEQPHVWDPTIVETDSFRHLVSLNPAWSMEESYMLPEETRITGVAELVVADGRITSTRFHPAWIGNDSTPFPVRRGSVEFDRIVDYLRGVTAEEGLDTRIDVIGDALHLSPA